MVGTDSVNNTHRSDTQLHVKSYRLGPPSHAWKKDNGSLVGKKIMDHGGG